MTRPASSVAHPNSPAVIPSSAAGAEQPDWRSIGIFFAVALAGLTAASLPFWFLEGGISHPLYVWLIALGMCSPALGTVVAVADARRRGRAERWRDAVGLRFRGRWRAIIVWSVVGVLTVSAITFAGAAVMVLRGVPGDLTFQHFLQTTTAAAQEAGAAIPPAAMLVIVLGAVVVNILLSAIPALGEEIGWRGWLHRQLLGLGSWTAIGVGGTIWALWHLPILLLGHNYPGAPRPYAIGLFIVFCCAANYMLVAITERAGGNPIPAALTHSALNVTFVQFMIVVSVPQTAEHASWWFDGVTGVVGIVLLTLAGFALMPRSQRTAVSTRAV